MACAVPRQAMADVEGGPADTLPATAQSSNSTSQSRYLEVSVSCHDGSHLGSYERGFDASTVLATGHVTGQPC